MSKFLIVDDEKLIREGLDKMIERVIPGHHCILAENGVTALEMIESYEFDIIISDIKMPEMDGMELARELFEKRYKIPFIFLTGLEEFKLVQQAMRYRVVDYLLKPIDSSELKNIILTNLENQSSKHGTEIPDYTKSVLNKFEFELINALESLNKENAIKLIKKALYTINDEQLIYQEIQRISNNFFIKKGIYGLDFAQQKTPLTNSRLIHLISDSIDQLKMNKGMDSIIDKAKNYIKQHIDGPPSLSEVADNVYLNPNYFSEYFKEKTGETFSHYLTRLRIDKSKELLRDTSMKIQDIAKNTGYQDVRHFRKQFKNAVGLSPKEYRKIY